MPILRAALEARFFVALAATFACVACHKDEGASSSGGPAPSASAAAPASAEPATSASAAGPLPAACAGASIDLAEAIVDPRCRIDSSRAKALRAAIEKDPSLARALHQEGAIAEGARVGVTLVNDGAVDVTIPLSWHAKLPAFTALAESDRRELFELEPPAIEPIDAGPGPARSHFAAITLPPKGRATIHGVVRPAIVKRLLPPCDAGTCAPAALPPGKYTLHVGELVADVEAGAPATMAWELTSRTP